MIFLISSLSLTSGNDFIMYSRGERSKSRSSCRCWWYWANRKCEFFRIIPSVGTSCWEHLKKLIETLHRQKSTICCQVFNEETNLLSKGINAIQIYKSPDECIELRKIHTNTQHTHTKHTKTHKTTNTHKINTLTTQKHKMTNYIKWLKKYILREIASDYHYNSTVPIKNAVTPLSIHWFLHWQNFLLTFCKETSKKVLYITRPIHIGKSLHIVLIYWAHHQRLLFPQFLLILRCCLSLIFLFWISDSLLYTSHLFLFSPCQWNSFPCNT